MKRLFAITLLFVGFSFSATLPKTVLAKEDCTSIGNIQCFRSLCFGGKTKVCKSNDYCYCYDPGETIQEGSCQGQQASGQSCTEYVTDVDIPFLPDPAEGNCADFEIESAIGCIPFQPQKFVGFIVGWLIGIGGGFAFLLILYSGFIIITSTGNPDRLKAGQELLTSAVMGLLLLIFSVFILRVVGVDILKIPGLTK